MSYYNKQFEILDCTLRDGAYQYNKDFPMNFNKKICKALSNSNIEYIEIGFLQEKTSEQNNVFKNEHDEKINDIVSSNRFSKITVLADFSRYNFDYLGPRKNTKIDVIRLCFYKHELNYIINTVEKIINLNYAVFLQPVDILSYGQIELSTLISIANQTRINCLSIVDTFGSMNNIDLESILDYFEKHLNQKIMIGLHTHNNSFQSYELMKKMIRYNNCNRKVIIDCTLSGIGRAAGNLPTEICMNYFNEYLNANYNVITMLEIIYYFNNIFYRSGYNIKCFMSAKYNAHINTIDYILTKVSSIRDLIIILDNLDEISKKRYIFSSIDKKINQLLT